jgi:hypothetical protein
MRDRDDETLELYSQKRLIPFWFKLSDIRPIDTSFLDNLRKYDLETKKEAVFDPTSRTPYPCGVIEKEPQLFFRSDELLEEGRTAWWEECRDNVLVPSIELRYRGKPSRKRDVFVLNRPREMARCVSSILRRSRDFRFVDPYFDPYNSRFIDTLSAFLTYATTERLGTVKSIEYHLAYQPRLDRPPLSIEAFERGCKTKAAAIVPKGIDVVFKRWRRRLPRGQRFHNRYIITDLAGVQFGEGLDRDREDSENVVLVILLESETSTKLWRWLDPESKVYEFVDEIKIRGKRKI